MTNGKKAGAREGAYKRKESENNEKKNRRRYKMCILFVKIGKFIGSLDALRLPLYYTQESSVSAGV